MNISHYFVEQKLLKIGNSLLKEPYKSNWCSDNPTYGYCYIVSEALYHFLPEKNVSAYCMNLGEIGTHWYIKKNDEIIDFTASQFDFPIDYTKSVRKGFFKGSVQTNRGYISKRGYKIAELLELI